MPMARRIRVPMTKWSSAIGEKMTQIEEIAAQVDTEIKGIVDTQYELAKKLLTENAHQHDCL